MRARVVDPPPWTLRLIPLLAVVVAGLPGCGGRDRTAAADAPDPGGDPGVVTLSVVGLNDLHGHAERLPVIGGYVANLRAARRDDGGVLVVDAGDMFQGTLVSNLGEGAAVVAGYDALGVVAAALGNHEFDYGPVGPAAVVPPGGDGDPRGALKARAAEAPFPILVSNVLDRRTRRRVDWPGMPATTVTEVAGVRVGIVGVTTEATLSTTLRGNVLDLAMGDLADTVENAARRLREDEGVTVVLVAAHAGGSCRGFGDPDDLSGCRPDEEIFRAARAWPAGLVDLVVAGHTHQAIAHVVAGVPIIESYAYGKAFGRVDLVVDRGAGRVVDRRVHPPHRVCAGDESGRDVSPDRCAPGSYEGAPVRPDPRVAAAVAPHLERARAEERRDLGVTLGGRFRQRYREESSLGNWLTDLFLAARPRADVALQNGGGIRDDLPPGRLRYGAFYRTTPFDNRFAFVRLRGRDLAEMIRRNLQATNGFLSVAGVRAEARCRGSRLEVTLRHAGDGRVLGSDASLLAVTNEYVVTSRDPVLRRLPQSAIEIEDGPPLRDVLARHLSGRPGARFAPDDYLDRDAPRIRFPGSRRPVRCR